MSLNRRNFIAGSAAMASAPALGAVSASGEVDVAIVGAGAAGIAAARKVAAAGRRYVLLEASDRIGGRCLTDTATFGVPYDRGAHWLHVPEINPLAKLAPRGFEVYPAPPGQKLRIGKRNAREGEMEDYLSAIVRANRAIQDAARGKSRRRAARRRCRRIWASGVRRWSSSSGRSAAARISTRSRRWISRARSSATSTRSAARALGALVAKLGSELTVQLQDRR